MSPERRRDSGRHSHARYDPGGNVTSYSDQIIGGSTYSTTFSYDNADQITGETRTGGTLGYAKTYAYADGRGNRTSSVINGTTNTFTYDSNNKFQSGGGYTASNYDADGSPQSFYVSGSGTWNFVYNYEDEPTSVTYPGGNQNTFRYNGDGQRVEKVDGTGTERYVYDGSDVVARVDASGNFLEYTLPGVGGIDVNGLQTFEQNNTLGSAVALRDSSGSLLRLDEFDAFGIGSTLSGTYTRPWQWGGAHGYFTDGQSGLVLCGARYYIPAIGRWLTQDPKGHDAGLNLYEYCQNNPLEKWDPTGLDTAEDRMWQSHYGNPAWLPIPRSPANYTLTHWVRVAESKRNMQWSYRGPDGDAFAAAQGLSNDTWFFEMVHTGGKMDFKRLAHGETQSWQYTDYGNFNYGVIGSALGFDQDTLLTSAGIAAFLHEHRWATSTSGPSRGDQARDQYFIRQGISWYNNVYNK